MLNVIANPLFQRTVRIVNDEYAKYITINYKPKNYQNDAITARIEFKRLCSRGIIPSGYEYEGAPVSFDVCYASGSLELGADIDPTETIENFRAALIDAVSIVNYVKERIKDSASFLEIAEEISAIDLPAEQSDMSQPVVLVFLGDYMVASKGMLFGHFEVAKKHLRALYQEAGHDIQFEERLATENESNYWWFKFKTNLIELIRD